MARRGTSDLNEPAQGIEDAMTREYPDCVAEPCNECPWRRDAMPGHLGPMDAREWAQAAHGETAIACHKTLSGDGWEGASQCRGAAIFRENVCKNPRNPTITTGPEDHDQVFSSNEQFVNHHEPFDPWLGYPAEFPRMNS